MEFKIFKNLLAKERIQNNLLKFFAICLVFSNLFLGFMSYLEVKNKTVVIVPVGYQHKIEVGAKVNEMYILEMARFIFDSLLNYTPSNVKLQYETILTLFAPEVYPQYKKIFESFVDEASTVHIASAFFINNIQHDNKNHLVKVNGTKLSILNGQVIETKQVSYAFTYRIHYGRLQLIKYGRYKNIIKNLNKDISQEESNAQ